MELGRKTKEEQTDTICTLVAKCPKAFITAGFTGNYSMALAPKWVYGDREYCGELLNNGRSLALRILGLACSFGVNLDTIESRTGKDMRVMIPGYILGIRRAEKTQTCTINQPCTLSALQPMQEDGICEAEEETDEGPITKRARVAYLWALMKAAGINVGANKAAAAKSAHYIMTGEVPNDIDSTTEYRLIKEMYRYNKADLNRTALATIRPLVERLQDNHTLIEIIDGYKI